MSPHKLAGLALASLLIWFSASALAQGGGSSTSVRVGCEGQVELDWGDGSRPAVIYFDVETADGVILGGGRKPSTGPHRLKENTSYQLFAEWGGGAEIISFRTSGDDCEPSKPRSKPPPITCPRLPPSIVISGYGQFTQCKRVDAAGVGKPELIEQGLLDAVDVHGIMDGEMQVCFRQQGELKFLDAATAPRAVLDLAAESVEGMTCGRIDRAGTVALLQRGEADLASAVSPESETAEYVVPMGDPPYICQLLTGDILNLRAGPGLGAEILAEIPNQTMLRPENRTADWFLVEYEGQRGWVHIDYVFQSPGCNSFSEPVAFPVAAADAPADSEADAEETEAEQMETSAPGAMALEGCELRTADILNLREGPGLEYDIKAEIPFLTIVMATERTREWFMVVYQGETGWVNFQYVFRIGACG